MKEFKVGDRVRRVGDSACPEKWGRKGETYTVLDVSCDGHIQVIDEGCHADYKKFELVKEEQKLDKVVISEHTIKKLGLCNWPAWLPEEVEISNKLFGFPGLLGKAEVRASQVANVFEFLNKLNKAFPMLADRIKEEMLTGLIWNNCIDTVGLTNLLKATMLLGKIQRFWECLVVAIKVTPECHDYFREKKEEFFPGDIIKHMGREYLVKNPKQACSSNNLVCFELNGDTPCEGTAYLSSSNVELVSRHKRFEK